MFTLQQQLTDGLKALGDWVDGFVAPQGYTRVYSDPS